jgi:16S rRNA (cytidine1402-2'-O)-methyltransferase
MKNEKNTSTGLLSIVSTPIGNNDDISQRAIVTIKKCDILVCEEGKIGSRLLFVHKITKPIELLNEHNEHEVVPLLIKELQNGKRIALISDCGTPVFADPGLSLVQACIARDISMEVVPGASSIMSAIVLSGFDLDRFLFAGFLSRKHEERDAQLINLSKETFNSCAVRNSIQAENITGSRCCRYA